MTRRILTITAVFFLLMPQTALSKALWYKCTVKGGSHTGRYTFKIDPAVCSVYWKEVDAQLKVQSCKLPVITALKPSARDDLTIVWFNMKTGQFYDYLSGFLDRGWCRVSEKP